MECVVQVQFSHSFPSVLQRVYGLWHQVCLRVVLRFLVHVQGILWGTTVFGTIGQSAGTLRERSVPCADGPLNMDSGVGVGALCSEVLVLHFAQLRGRRLGWRGPCIGLRAAVTTDGIQEGERGKNPK